ncbi:MAG: type II secretion system F family protein [Planctomycetota bacterium]|nr:type II secretion system F family protein [Planctomycetota bacterium]
MATFAYIARNHEGEKVTGRLAGPSRQIVLAELESRRLSPVQLKEVNERTWRPTRISLRQRSQAYRQIGDLIRAGVPLLRGLRVLGRSKAHPKLAIIMGKVADDVAEGERLAEAMRARDGVFPDMEIAMIRAGERGGFLEEVLHRLATFIEVQADMRSKIIGNLIYPLVLVGMGLLVIVGFMLFIVPQFRDFYSRIELPWPTKVILGGSDLLMQHWGLLLMAMIGLGAGWMWLLRQPTFIRAWESLILKLPQIGPLLRSIAVARFARILGTLLGNGVPMLPAMKISKEAAGNVLLAEAIEKAAKAVERGETLATPLLESGMMGEEVVEMIMVGESANNLPEVLITIAETIDKRVDRMLNLFVRLMEPAILLVLGLVVMFLFVALIMPMMRMRSAI